MTLEITEATVTADPERVVGILRALRGRERAVASAYYSRHVRWPLFKTGVVRSQA